MRNEKNIVRHELIGLYCEVAGSRNKSLVGISGRIIDETMKTLLIGQSRKRVAKRGSRFRISLGNKQVIVDGDMLAARPEDRIKKKFRKW